MPGSSLAIKAATQFASTTRMAPVTRASAAAVQAFAERGGVAVVHCEKGQRIEAAMQRRLEDVNVTEVAKRAAIFQ